MTVTAVFEVLPDDALIKTLESAKPELNNDDSALKATLQKLNAKQDPRRCEEVRYYAEIFINGQSVDIDANAKTEHSDKWLDKLFNK